MRSALASAYARGALCASLLRTPLARASSSALRSARVVMRKRLGQHLLTNPDVVANIVAHARIAPGERVFEIGPGTGNLTAHLLASPAAVVFAVELDERLFSLLQSRADALPGGSKLQCVRGDFLRVPLPTFDVLVANIPYQISSPVLRRLFAHAPLPRAAVIMFQAEFAERMVARPGGATYCRLSVNCQLLASVRLVQRVAASQFRPPPRSTPPSSSSSLEGGPPASTSPTGTASCAQHLRQRTRHCARFSRAARRRSRGLLSYEWGGQRGAMRPRRQLRMWCTRPWAASPAASSRRLARTYCLS